MATRSPVPLNVHESCVKYVYVGTGKERDASPLDLAPRNLAV